MLNEIILMNSCYFPIEIDPYYILPQQISYISQGEVFINNKLILFLGNIIELKITLDFIPQRTKARTFTLHILRIRS